MGSGVSRARPSGVRLAGAMRSKKNRVAGSAVTGGGSCASFRTASTNVRLPAAAVTPVNVS